MKKSMSIFTLFCLLLTGVPAGAEPGAGSPEPVMQITDLAIPESLGKIEGRFAGTSSRWVIVIQDIHAHLTAQENISAIVDHLNQLYGIETFALEGGWSKTKLFKSNRLPNSQAKQQLARVLLEDAYLTGPAYSGLFSPSPLKLVGMENKKLYLENRDAFLAQLEGRGESLEKAEILETKIASLKKETYGAKLLNFDSALGQFREGNKVDTFLPSLVKIADELKIDLSDLDQMTVFKEIMAEEASIDKEKLESEAKRLMKFAEDPRLSFEEILRSGRIAEPQLVRYPETVKFQTVLRLQDALSHHAFFAQIEKTINRVKEKLFRNDAEKNLDARAERFILAKKILKLEAVPEDIRKAAAEIGLIREEMAGAGLRGAFNKCARFYKFAKQRDSVFFKNISSQPLLAGNIAMVAGGFHTEGVTARLEKAGVSYIIITPSLGEKASPPDHTLYIERMSEVFFNKEVRKQTLAPYGIFFNYLFDKKAFEDGVKSREKIPDVKLAEQTLLKSLQKPAGKTGAAGAASVKSFLSLTRDDQKKQVGTWLDEIKRSKIPITLGIRTSALKKILAGPAGMDYWKNYIISDRLLTLGEFQDTDDYLVEPFMGMRRPPFKIRMENGASIGPLQIGQLLKIGKKTPAALIDENYKGGNSEITVLPERAGSFMAARLLLENKLSGNISAEFFQRIEDLLVEIFSSQELEVSA